MEDNWLATAKRLQAIASTGLHFGESEFDEERYQEIHDIASEMLADLGQIKVEAISELLGAPGKGYETPKVDVRGALFRDGKVLLVREKLDNLWTLPGGYADVGISPAENIIKEVQEEANLNVTTKQLYAVIHKARHSYDMDIRDFYKFYFVCEQIGNDVPKPGSETLDAGFFDLNDLPPLSTGRVIEKHIKLALRYIDNPELPTYFD